MVKYPNVYIEQWENFKKGSYRNRCYIAGVNGALRLSIPLKKGKNQQQNIKEVQIAYDQPWKSQHWTSIRSAYGNAPYFDHYADQIQPIFQKDWTFLFDFNWALVDTLSRLIGIESTIKMTEEYQKETKDNIVDFRNKIHPKKEQEKENVDFKTIKYPQVFEEKTGFLANLSILDLLFCTGPQSLLILEETSSNSA